jgi:hypothetical protein
MGDRIEGRDPSIFADVQSTDRPDSSEEVVVVDSNFSIVDVATEETLAEWSTITDSETSNEFENLDKSGTQSETLKLDTTGKPSVVLYYSVDGDSTLTVSGATTENGTYRTIETIDTSTNEYDTEDVLYFPWTDYNWLKIDFSSSSDRDVILEPVAGR